MRPFLAALVLSAVIMGGGWIAMPESVRHQAIAKPAPAVVRVPTRDQSRLMTGVAVPYFNVSQLSFELACAAIYEPIKPIPVKTISYRKEDAEPKAKPKQQAKRKAGE